MKMKKLLSVLLAAMIIAAAGCSDNGDADTTTTTTTDAEAEAITTTAAETTTEATTTEAETTPAETEAAVENPFMTEEIKEFIEEVRAEAPIYADFLESSSSIPLTMGLAYEMDVYGTGEMSEVKMEMGMASPEKFYVSTDTAGIAMDIIIADGVCYMVSAEEKTALYMTMSEEEAASMSEEMTASVKASFDASAAEYETGETKLDGTTYLYEKITADETGEIMVYADTATKEVRFVSNQGIVMEITALSNSVDESKLEIPADYTLIDMAEMMGTTDTEFNSGDASADAALYLEFSAFSYNGLVEQLEFDGYTHEEAVAAADACGADWNEQAVKCAAEYLDYSTFTREELIEQLEFEGFTTEQAVYGVETNGL